MAASFTFDPEKALEALVYICSKSGADVYRALKIFYAADKFHLHRYGRFIAGDYYKRLPHGPVPQGAYDILHYVRGRHTESPVPEARQALEIPAGKNDIKVLRAPDLAALSETDLECLNEAIARDGEKGFYWLRRESHKDAACEATPEGQVMSVEAIAAMAPENRESLLQYLANRYPDKSEAD